MASLPGPDRLTIGSVLDRVHAILGKENAPDPGALFRSICPGDIAGLALVHDLERHCLNDRK